MEAKLIVDRKEGKDKTKVVSVQWTEAQKLENKMKLA